MEKNTIISPVPITNIVLGSGMGATVTSPVRMAQESASPPRACGHVRPHTEGGNTWFDAADREGRKTIPFIRKNGPIEENTL